MRILSLVVLSIVSSTVLADSLFVQPTSWRIPRDDHYNMYTEDSKHPCTIGGINENAAECTDWNNRTPKGYVLRNCEYRGQCSIDKDGWQHAGVDYDYPSHEHDPADYVNGQRKHVGLRQGKDASLDHHDGDDILASNDGVVTYADYAQANFGNTVIIRHLCDPSDGKAQELCETENGELVIYTQYSHMSNISVSVGDAVVRRQKIGEMGGSGKDMHHWIHHLHLEFKTEGVYYSPKCNAVGYTYGDPDDCGYRDPLDFIDKMSVAPATGGNNLEPNTPPTGSVDTVSCTTISGWAKDPDTEGVIDIHAYINGSHIDTISATGYRPDIGNHAFSWTVPPHYSTGAHEMTLYAINYPEGDNPVLQKGSFVFDCSTMSPCPGLTRKQCIAAIMIILD